MVKVYAPASSANMSVGFDVLGAAVTPVDGTLLGTMSRLRRRQALACKTWVASPVNCRRRRRKISSINAGSVFAGDWQEGTGGDDLKNMPIGSGTGSSACSVVAALVAMNEFCGKPLNESRMLALMGEMEGRISGSIHYDNVAPCYLGGIQLMLEENGIISQQIPAFDEWLWVLAYPGIKVSTAEARAICRRSIAVRTVLPTVVIWRALFTPAIPPASAGGEIDERCDCRTVSYQTTAGLQRSASGSNGNWRAGVRHFRFRSNVVCTMR